MEKKEKKNSVEYNNPSEKKNGKKERKINFKFICWLITVVDRSIHHKINTQVLHSKCKWNIHFVLNIIFISSVRMHDNWIMCAVCSTEFYGFHWTNNEIHSFVVTEKFNSLSSSVVRHCTRISVYTVHWARNVAFDVYLCCIRWTIGMQLCITWEWMSCECETEKNDMEWKKKEEKEKKKNTVTSEHWAVTVMPQWQNCSKI